MFLALAAPRDGEMRRLAASGLVLGRGRTVLDHRVGSEPANRPQRTTVGQPCRRQMPAVPAAEAPGSGSRYVHLALFYPTTSPNRLLAVVFLPE
jgi:hypothetical protein